MRHEEFEKNLFKKIIRSGIKIRRSVNCQKKNKNCRKIFKINLKQPKKAVRLKIKIGIKDWKK